MAGASSWELVDVDKGDVSLEGKISEGTESVVYIGDWQGQVVAVKKYKIRTSADLLRFRQELEMMAMVDHQNVVSALAAKRTAPDRLMLMPLATGNLEQEIHGAGWRPDWKQVVSTAAQVASGVCHLHQKGIIHRDIKPSNILLMDGRQRAVVTDLGISEYSKVLEAERTNRSCLLQGGGKPTGGFHKKRLVGTLQYMAPELLLKEPQSAASDVYAWAVVVNELATGTVPFSDCTKDNPACHTVLEMGYGQAELAAAVASEGLRPLLRPDTPEGLQRLLESCWELMPAKRPTMEQVLQELDTLAASQALDQSGAAKAGNAWLPSAAHEVVLVHEASETDMAARDCGSARQKAPWYKGTIPEGWSHANVTAGSYETAGTRGVDKMEDRHIVAKHAGGGEGGPMLLGVFDGHRGHEAAEFMAEHLESQLGLAWASCSGPGEALRTAFLAVDSSFVQQQQREWDERVARMGAAASGPRVRWPGCTALAAVIHASQLHIANAGDCRAILCRDGAPVQLSRDHTTADHQERQRIIDAGGKVAWRVDSWRIGEAAIQVTRSIGDYDLRSHGLLPEPEITEHNITALDEFLVIASDGLFDVLNNDEVVGLVHDTVKEPSMCGQRLATEALTRGSNDNITVVVAFLKPVSTLESIYSNGRQKYGITPTLYGTRQEMLAHYSRSRAADEVQDMCY